MTFSQLIDSIMQETKRFDLQNEFVSFLNQSIRELHFEPERGNAVLYDENYQETQLTATTETGFSWEIENPERFQIEQAVRFDSVIDQHGRPRYATKQRPGPRLEQLDYVYQRAGRQILFKGYGGIGGVISLSYYAFPPALKFYAAGSRPATFDPESGWAYHEDYNSTPELQAEAELITSNWLTQRWHTVLEEALRAKVYKRLGDETRQRTSYSMYTQLRRGLYISETAETGMD